MTETQRQLTDNLRKNIDQMPPRLQAAAKYIVDHPADFGLDPIRVTAEKIGVSANVLVRLAQYMGYGGFQAFRSPFRQNLATDNEEFLGPAWQTHMHAEGAHGKLQAKLARNEQNVVVRSLRLMRPDTAHLAIEHILGSRRCFVTATRASYALAYYFSYNGRMAHPGIQLIPRHIGSATDDLLDADDKDCLLAITVSPYSAETIKSVRYAREKGLRVILISDSEVIAPGVEPDVAFTVSTRSQHHTSSFTGVMAVLECLIGHLFDAGGKTAAHRVEAYQKAREDTGAYWQPNKLPKIRRK
ncbi:MurR/RpiR family transcriptional regulator [Ruegeria faecimaris]|uniref:MurR/RpiR family transcriptional regulator n=1 Tax=Ruegeria faecimaris TaxID=686389 RepID=UPI00249379E1|nr:MurR/RpiR family transcriptional regulator [Ruegeria faecimaris]